MEIDAHPGVFEIYVRVEEESDTIWGNTKEDQALLSQYALIVIKRKFVARGIYGVGVRWIGEEQYT